MTKFKSHFQFIHLSLDSSIEEEYAHKLADDKKWDDVKVLTSSQIAQICGTDSGTATKIFEVMAGSSKAAQRAAARIDKTLLRRKAARRSRSSKRATLPIQRADVHTVQTSYAFKLLLDEMKSLGVAMRLELEDRK